jgi:predicted HicB family RNase H-like nuclease
MLEDAKKCWFTACIEDGLVIPEPKSLDEYSGQFKLRIPKSLHKELAERSQREGISMNQYCVYLLSRNLQ